MIRHLEAAAIPLLDLPGPDFLAWYAMLFLTAVGLALAIRGLRLNAFSRPDENDFHDLVKDPVLMAYLAAGENRAMQTALAQLLNDEWLGSSATNAATRTSRLWHLRPQPGKTPPAFFRSLQKHLLEHQGNKFTNSDLTSLLRESVRYAETELAVRGLRPTARESAGIATACSVPFFLLLALGGVKLLLGLMREKPVLYLLGGLAVTVFALIAVRSHPPLLTSRGQACLRHLRERLPRDDLRKRHQHSISAAAPALPGFESPAFAAAIALYGVRISLGIPYEEVIPTILPDHPGVAKKASDNTSGCGGGTGCGGDSGCGGGGDGGCGGCGGD